MGNSCFIVNACGLLSRVFLKDWPTCTCIVRRSECHPGYALI